MRHRTVFEVNQQGHTDQHQEREIRADAAGILQPLSNIQANDIEEYRHDQQHKRNGQKKCLVLRQGGALPPHNVCAH